MIATRNDTANHRAVQQRCWMKAGPPEEVTMDGAKARGTGKFWTWRLSISHFVLSGQCYTAYEREARAIY